MFGGSFKTISIRYTLSLPVFPTFYSWLNHVVHTNVALLAIMDLFTCFRRYPSRLAGITGNVSFILLYIIWLHIVRYFSGEWVYPILEVL